MALILVLFTGGGPANTWVLDFKNIFRSLVKPVSDLYKERRRRSRLPLSCDVLLSGSCDVVHAVAVDISRHGMAVRSDVPMEPAAQVFVRIPGPGLAGFAHVRRCSQSGNHYLIGLEFRDRLTRDRDDTGTWDRRRFEAGGGSGWEGWDD